MRSSVQDGPGGGAVVGDRTVEQGERGRTVIADRPHTLTEEFEELAGR
ncbi:hypothetical protein [Streptomyces sp. NPDC001502]